MLALIRVAVILTVLGAVTGAPGDAVLLAPTLAWVVAAVVRATRLFRWEPRR
ncbi:hypothetical protein ACQPZJ_24800 [Actinoplanes sp. CA-054009]